MKKAASKKEHIHDFVRGGTRGSGARGKTFIFFYCKECKEQLEKPATPAECKELRVRWARDHRRSKLMNKAWHTVLKLWKRIEESGVGWVREGKDQLSAGMEKLAVRFPDDIHYARVDDSHHAGSDLWFVAHKYDDKKIGKGYWGTSVIYIGQCSDDPPVEFFLYPSGHMKSLLTVVTKLDKLATAMNKGKPYGDL